MSHYSRLIAEAHGLGTEAADIVFSTAPMHDIGKIGIPDSILLKPGKLDASEWEIMRQHPLMGAEIIGKHDNELLETARIISLSHHEKWDGSGYPLGLKGEEIPLEGRIVALADAFDIMTHPTSYTATLTLSQARAEIEAMAGKQFDPELSNLFVQLIDREGKKLLATTNPLQLVA